MTKEEMERNIRLQNVAKKFNETLSENQVGLSDARFVLLYMLGLVRMQMEDDIKEFWNDVGMYGYQLDAHAQSVMEKNCDGLN